MPVHCIESASDGRAPAVSEPGVDRVFVYGTLKEGFPNYPFNHGVREAGEFVTVTPYPLYLVGERYVPCLFDVPGEGACVSGQVFAVDDASLAVLDELERVGEPDGYRRLAVDVRHEETQQIRRLFVYMKPRRLLMREEIRQGPLTDYTADHAAHYVSRR